MNSSSITVPVLLVSAGLLLGLSGCRRSGPAATGGRYEEESQFIVQSLLEDLLGMTQWAVAGTLVTDASRRVRVEAGEEAAWGHPDYRVSLRGKSGGADQRFKLVIERPVWDPAVYGPVLDGLFQEIGRPVAATEPAGTEGPSLLEELLALDAPAIERANERVSQALREEFRQPVQHERAALLLGVFGLREAAGVFSDVRSVLGRMTAHLAFARALAPERAASGEGRVAEVLLYALMGHQTGALERLQSWPPEPAMAPWKRALRAWVTGDYRELNAVKERTPLEQIGWFSSYARSVQPTIAWEELAPEMLAARPDFCRMAQELALSVELGHQLSRLSLALELQEIGQVFKVSGRPPPGPEGLSSWLNELPSPCVSPGPGGAARIRVISEGHWAQFLQRHLCHTLVQNHRFLRRLWGVPEAAADFVRQTSGPFEKLRLYPFVQRAHADDEKTYRQAVDAAVRVIAQTPELVPAALWNQLYEPPPAGLPVYHSPHCRDVSEWHRHNPPPFTAHRASDRVHHVSLIRQADAVERLEALHALAPYDAKLTRVLLHLKYGNNGQGQPEEVLAAAYGPLLEYSAPVLAVVGQRLEKDPVAYERFLLRAAARNGAYYFRLGDYFAQRGDAAKAAQYFEEGFEKGPDAVQAANHAPWLVRHYFAQGKLAEADRWADFAADVYSYRGLQAKGELLFLKGEYRESLDYYHKIEERYADPRCVVRWWVRYRAQTDQPDFDEEIEQRKDTLFPKGVRPIRLQGLSDPPTAGVIIQEENDLIRAAGLKKGDIIVGLQDQRVETLEQYVYLRTRLAGGPMRLLVWNGTRYLEASADPPRRRFGAAFDTYLATP